MRQALRDPTPSWPCVGVVQALIHSSYPLHRNVYYSVFARFLQAELAKAL